MPRAYPKFLRLAIAAPFRKFICKNAHPIITKVSNIIPIGRWQSDKVVV
ncbi:hypothetical protein CES85_1463 [Ochrobactrum quorumnocens]|uniref:Uncharacterized protein n=1 Tax=Ochrobactrum quorumnocens TaxID=271865 RepID=A0A248UF14_9HYPH|nr:hypothetical protein CES85_1463 [[Ochrobactrum] quorumnocens]